MLSRALALSSALVLFSRVQKFLREIQACDCRPAETAPPTTRLIRAFASPRTVLEQEPLPQEYAHPGSTSAPGPPLFEEVAWDREAANAVTLIGYTGGDLTLNHVSGGLMVAKGRLAVKAGKDKHTEWCVAQ